MRKIFQRLKLDNNLSEKQKLFIQVYEGNGADAARKSGYLGSDKALAQRAYELLTNPKIVRLIRKRNDPQKQALIATRIDRQKFWSDTMNDPTADPKDRLKASELLGRSEGDFIEKHEVKTKHTFESLIVGSMVDVTNKKLSDGSD